MLTTLLVKGISGRQFKYSGVAREMTLVSVKCIRCNVIWVSSIIYTNNSIACSVIKVSSATNVIRATVGIVGNVGVSALVGLSVLGVCYRYR